MLAHRFRNSLSNAQLKLYRHFYLSCAAPPRNVFLSRSLLYARDPIARAATPRAMIYNAARDAHARSRMDLVGNMDFSEMGSRAPLNPLNYCQVRAMEPFVRYMPSPLPGNTPEF